MTNGQHSQVPPEAAEAREIDAVLSLASVPPLPEGAAARLMARIAQEPQENKVVAFAPRRAARVWWIMSDMVTGTVES